MDREDARKLKAFLKAAPQETVASVPAKSALPVFEVTRFTAPSA
jgi:hypothetical protein